MVTTGSSECMWDGADVRDTVAESYRYSTEEKEIEGKCTVSPAFKESRCKPCPPCVDCDTVPGQPMVKQGHAFSAFDTKRKFLLSARNDDVRGNDSSTGKRNIFQCPYDHTGEEHSLQACNGEIFMPDSQFDKEAGGTVVTATCAAGQSGPLCDICLQNYFRGE